MANRKPPLVLDNGTGYSKIGYAGNNTPDFIIPTMIADLDKKKGLKSSPTDDLDFYIGAEAVAKKRTHNVHNILKEGCIDNWDEIEKYWQRVFFEYMHCDPEEHYMLLTEPPLNPPENREQIAEIMFETFNVPGLYIGVQAVLALIASRLAKGVEKQLTGTVVDSGDGVTHVIPVVDGYVIGSCIKHVPMAGSNITNFILQILRDRGEKMPAVDARMIARTVKEKFSYVAPDIVKEYIKFDNDPEKFKVYEGVDPKTGKTYKVDVGYERFLGPEMFFNPEIFSSQHTTSLPDLVDQTIQACPIDTRRQLYRNVSLSGGSTIFKDFSRRLQRDIKRIVKKRVAENERINKTKISNEVEVKVIAHKMQRFAVWFGGSILGEQPQFYEMAHTKAKYEEYGPSIARKSPVFSSL